MTVTALIKVLEAIRDDGGGRLQAVINKDSLWDGNQTFNNCDIHAVEVETIYVVDGDGGIIVNKDGSHRCRTSAVIKGKS